MRAKPPHPRKVFMQQRPPPRATRHQVVCRSRNECPQVAQKGDSAPLETTLRADAKQRAHQQAEIEGGLLNYYCRAA